MDSIMKFMIDCLPIGVVLFLKSDFQKTADSWLSYHGNKHPQPIYLTMELLKDS
jgi:hypothetical protein